MSNADRLEQINGTVQFSITVTPFEMKEWSPERIARFFLGIAMVLHAVRGT